MSDISESLRPIPDIMEHLTFLLKKGESHNAAADLGADIFDLIEAKFSEFCAFPTEHALTAAVLWTAHCWFLDVLSTTPRLLFVSPEAGSGKSNALKVMKCLTPFAVRSENATPAWVYREMEKRRLLNGRRATIMLDELDCVFKPGKDNAEFRKIIDAGAYLGGTVDRAMAKDTVRYDVFGPLALAGKMLAGDVPDTIRTRCITIQMQRSAKGQAPKRWYERSSPAEVTPLFVPLRRWSEFVHWTAKEYRPPLPEEIWSRDADCWEPLLMVADMAGGRWPDRARAAAVAGVTGVTGVNAEPSEGIELLWEIHAIFEERKVDKIFTSDLLDELRATGLFRWTNKEPIPAAKRLAQILSGYGVVRDPDQRIGRRNLKGYDRESFVAAWAAYPTPVTPVTLATAGAEGDDD
jgi:hypothetical protein